MIQDSYLERRTTSSGLSRHERWLLWFSGGVALAIALVAFVLWSTRGSAYLLDLLVAVCL
jgi:Flp pilus assembly protein TadB